MKKIIIATDFSNEADNAMFYAANICLEYGYELILFTLRTMSVHAMNAKLSNQSIDEISISYQNEIDDIASSISTAFSISVTSYLATGDFYKEIKRCIVQTNSDLVVIGMAGNSFEQDILGTSNTSIIQDLNIPTLIVPLSVKYSGIKHVLFVCDLLQSEQTKELDTVHKVVTDFNATLEIFHDNYKFNAIDPKADLIITVPHKDGFWESLAHRSKTIQMIFRCNVAMLSLPR